MRSNRFALVAGMLALGAAACGDDVQVVEPAPPVPRLRLRSRPRWRLPRRRCSSESIRTWGNRGKESYMSNQDCTIRASCRSAMSGSAGSDQRSNRVNWQA